MKKRVLGVLGVLFGGAIILSRLLGTTEPSANSAYRTGQIAGLIFGVIIFAVGIYYLIKKGSN